MDQGYIQGRHIPEQICYDQMIRLFQNLSHDYFT
jgi:hypothetical protein